MSYNNEKIINKKIPNVEKEKRLIEEFKNELKKEDPVLYESLKDLSLDEMVKVLSKGI